MKAILRMGLLCLIMLCACLPGRAADDPPALTDEQKKKIAEATAAKAVAEAQKAKYEAEKAAAEAAAAAAKAQLPELDLAAKVSGVASTTETGEDKKFFEAQVLATEETDRIAARIASTLHADTTAGTGQAETHPVNDCDTLVILGSGDAANVQKALTLRTQLKVLHKSLEKAVQRSQQFRGPQRSLGPAFAEGLSAANSLVRSALDVIGMFRTETKVGISAADKDDLALASALAGQLAGKVKVYHPSRFQPNLFNEQAYEDSVLMKQIDAVLLAVQDASLELDSLERREGELKSKVEGNGATQADKDAYNAFVARLPLFRNGLKGLIDHFEKQFTAITSADATGNTILSAAVNADLIYNSLACGVTPATQAAQTAQTGCGAPTSPPKVWFLTLEVAQAGGSYMTKKSILTFFHGPGLYHSGGASVNWALFSCDGRVSAANNELSYSGFIRTGRLKDHGKPPR